MLGGYNGKILHVDLSKEETSVEEPGEDFYRRYMGGKSLALYYLLNEMEPEVDPLGPDNLLIFAPGVITGALLPGTARFTVAAKSPLTESFGGSEAGGFFGPELKSAGYDAVIVKGKADEPVYLWIHDGEVEIRDASELWGKTGKETQEGIREELEDDGIRIALIGPAGEKLVRFACIANELKHMNGRGGLGAVMGSKNLKAVAARGTKRIEVKDSDKVKSLAKWFAENYMEKGDTSGLHDLGTPILVNVHDELGALPTRNFHRGSFEGAEEISGETLDVTFNVGQKACFSCPVACKRVVKVDDLEVDPAYGGSEYETLGSLGSNCGVDDLKTILKAGEICNACTMDTISTGMSIAFAMECFENGIITKEDTGGLELKFGNAEAMLKMVKMIAEREGLGEVLAEGVKRAAQKIEDGAEKFALHVKGRELPMHEPRLKAGVGLGYAVAPIGADHTQMEHDPCFEEENPMLDELSQIGILEPVKSQDIGPQKVRLFKYLQHWWTLGDCVGLCIFSTAPARVWKIQHVAQMVNAVTGWDTTIWELMKVGERCDTMARVFNIREGFTKEDDRLPDRFFEPLEGGPLEGDKLSKDEFKQAIATYYHMMGWNEEGVPTKTKLAELNIGWVADEL